MLGRREAEPGSEDSCRIFVADTRRHFVHPSQLATPGHRGKPFGLRHDGRPDTLPSRRREHRDAQFGHVAVLPAVHRQVADAHDPAVVGVGRQAAMLLRAVVVEGHGPSFRPLPPRLVGPAFVVRGLHDSEPRVERHLVARVDLPHLHGYVTRSFCQNVPSATTSKPSMSFSVIIGTFSRALPVVTTRTPGTEVAR